MTHPSLKIHRKVIAAAVAMAVIITGTVPTHLFRVVWDCPYFSVLRTTNNEIRTTALLAPGTRFEEENETAKKYIFPVSVTKQGVHTGDRAVLRFTAQDRSRAELRIYTDDFENELGRIELAKDNEDLAEAVRRGISRVRFRKAEYPGIINSMLGPLTDEPPALYTFEDIVGGRVSFTSATTQSSSSLPKIIILHRSISKDVVAICYGIGKYLIKSNKMRLKLAESRDGKTKLLYVAIGDNSYVVEISKDVQEELRHNEEWWHNGLGWLNKRRNQYYLLRVLQREIFTTEYFDMDKWLAQIIWRQQVDSAARKEGAAKPSVLQLNTNEYSSVTQGLRALAEGQVRILSLSPLLGRVSDCFFDWGGTLEELAGDSAATERLFKHLTEKGIRVHIITEGGIGIAHALGQNMRYVTSVVLIGKNARYDTNIIGFEGSKQNYLTQYIQDELAGNADKVMLVDDTAKNFSYSRPPGRVIKAGVLALHPGGKNVDAAIDGVLLARTGDDEYGTPVYANYYLRSLKDVGDFFALVELIGKKNGKLAGDSHRTSLLASGSRFAFSSADFDEAADTRTSP